MLRPQIRGSGRLKAVSKKVYELEEITINKYFLAVKKFLKAKIFNFFSLIIFVIFLIIQGFNQNRPKPRGPSGF
jgi:hypothetical protein